MADHLRALDPSHDVCSVSHTTSSTSSLPELSLHGLLHAALLHLCWVVGEYFIADQRTSVAARPHTGTRSRVLDPPIPSVPFRAPGVWRSLVRRVARLFTRRDNCVHMSLQTSKSPASRNLHHAHTQILSSTTGSPNMPAHSFGQMSCARACWLTGPPLLVGRSQCARCQRRGLCLAACRARDSTVGRTSSGAGCSQIGVACAARGTPPRPALAAVREVPTAP